MRLGGRVGFDHLLQHRGEPAHPRLELVAEVLHAHPNHLELGHFLHRQGIVRIGGDERLYVRAHGARAYRQVVQAVDGFAHHRGQLFDRGFGIHFGNFFREQLFQSVDLTLDGGQGGFEFPGF